MPTSKPESGDCLGGVWNGSRRKVKVLAKEGYDFCSLGTRPSDLTAYPARWAGFWQFR